MSRYLARRLVSLPFTLLGVSVLTFLFLRLIPGDAITARLGTSTALSAEQMAQLRAFFGLDQPLYLQYLSWLGSLLRGDAGYSIRTGQPVFAEIAARLPVTIELAVAAASVAGGAPVGLAWLIALRALGGGAYLRLLLVAEGQQGHGLGERLLRAAEEHARLEGDHLYLLVTRDNAGARRFYERHGYRHVGDLPGLVHPAIDESLYHRTLGRRAERPDQPGDHP